MGRWGLGAVFEVREVTCSFCILKKQKGEDESDEELDDEAMMALDKNISALFAEQQKRIQAKKDEKDRIRKEKILRRDFKIKVWDKYPKQTALASQLACCSLLHAMSYLMLNSLDIHVCCKLMKIGTGFLWLVQHLMQQGHGQDWGFTYRLKKENKVVLFKKWTVGLICLSEMLPLTGSLPALTHKAGTFCKLDKLHVP